MAKSTQVISDLKTAVAATPSAAAQGRAQNPNDFMQDIVGMKQNALNKAQELLKLLNELVLDSTGATTNAIVQAGDPDFTTLDSVRQVLV